MDKSFFRKEVKLKRKAQIEIKKELDASIYNKVISLEQYKTSDSIFIYLDYNYEVDTRNIIENAIKHNKKVYLPRIENKEMITVPIYDLNNLVKSNFNILEPIGNEEKIKDNTLIIMPGVAFSEKGERIGYGGGFYDRFLNNKNNIRIALAYECQIYKDLPTEEHDIKVPIIITEKRIIKN